MAALLKLVLIFAAFFLFLGLMWLLAAKLGLIKPEAKKAAAADQGPDALGYRVRERVLSPAEHAFLTALREAVQAAHAGPPPTVLASVRLAEVLVVDAPRSGNRSAWQSAFNKLASKQVDFVVCDPVTTRPLLVVELDDQTHDRPDRQARDGLVDRACASAGLPILHVRAAARHDPRQIAGQIAAALATG